MTRPGQPIGVTVISADGVEAGLLHDDTVHVLGPLDAGEGRDPGDPEDGTERTCAVEGCDRPRRVRTWCRAHYEAWRRRRTSSAATAAPGPPRMSVTAFCERLEAGEPLARTYELRESERETFD